MDRINWIVYVLVPVTHVCAEWPIVLIISIVWSPPVRIKEEKYGQLSLSITHVCTGSCNTCIC